MNNRTRMVWIVGIAALCAAVLSACASATAAPSPEPPTEASTPAPTEAPTEVATATEAPTEAATATEAATEAAAPAEVIVNMATDPKLGPMLVDGKGLTLYLFTKDTPNKSVCYDKCATAWPPLFIAEDGKVTAGPGVTGTFSNIERDDGTYMVAYNGVALYYYVKDKNPGDVIGEGVQNVWHVVKP